MVYELKIANQGSSGTLIFRKCNGINEFSKCLVVQAPTNNFLKLCEGINAVLTGAVFLWIFD